MKRTSTDPSGFIASLPEPQRGDIAELDAEISRVMEGSARVLWEGNFWGGTEQNIIGYGEHTYESSRGETVEWFIVGLALQKNHLSVYVSAVDNGRYLTEAYKDRLGKAKVGKSSIGFKTVSDVNLPVLLEMVARAKDLMTADQGN